MSKLPQIYKTLVLADSKLSFVTRIFKPSITPQLIIRPLIVGICRSDIKEFLGTRTVRRDFGHEVLGEVIWNNDQKLPEVGRSVVIDPHVLIKRDSGFGELLVASGEVASLENAFITVSPSIPKDKLVFVEPLSCAYHCVSSLFRYVNRERLDGFKVAIVGAGMMGILISLLCKYYGANISIINRGQERLNFIRSRLAIDAHKLCTKDEVKEEFDVVIPTTTFLYPEVLKLCGRIVRNESIILLFGGTVAGDVFPDADDINIDEIRRGHGDITVRTTTKTVRLCGTHGATKQDFNTIISILTKSPQDFPVEKLISRRIRLSEVPRAIAEMSHREVLGKIVMTI